LLSNNQTWEKFNQKSEPPSHLTKHQLPPPIHSFISLQYISLLLLVLLTINFLQILDIGKSYYVKKYEITRINKNLCYYIFLLHICYRFAISTIQSLILYLFNFAFNKEIQCFSYAFICLIVIMNKNLLCKLH
jgi:hypothetical protein